MKKLSIMVVDMAHMDIDLHWSSSGRKYHFAEPVISFGERETPLPRAMCRGGKRRETVGWGEGGRDYSRGKKSRNWIR